MLPTELAISTASNMPNLSPPASTLRSEFLKEKISLLEAWEQILQSQIFARAFFSPFSLKAAIRARLETDIVESDSRIIIAYPRRGQYNPDYDLTVLFLFLFLIKYYRN